MVQCDDCDGLCTHGDDKYYNVRTTADGTYYGGETQDFLLCGVCLAARLSTSEKRGKIQSILRIDNPLM